MTEQAELAGVGRMESGVILADRSGLEVEAPCSRLVLGRLLRIGLRSVLCSQVRRCRQGQDESWAKVHREDAISDTPFRINGNCDSGMRGYSQPDAALHG